MVRDSVYNIIITFYTNLTPLQCELLSLFKHV